ncbi:MAG: D-alanyl-D-alanine carboxypeptidase [Clostridia bacterium]|nr:D-alanyl-D-alanine carboxypeptidase [Clostridia bacterium]
MKRIIRCTQLFILVFTLLGVMPTLAAPSVLSPTAILIDGASGIMLYGKAQTQKAYPASTTKVMTAILALENGNFDDKVTVSFQAVNSISFDSSKAGWYEGEIVSFKDLVYSLLICSANDSANVIAEHVAGSIDAFVEKMNIRAQELGATNTHFVNTHGLHNEDHYTTAEDMAKLARFAMQMPAFREIVSLRTYTIAPTNKSETPRHLDNTNHLLNPSHTYYYENAVGIKTGYTDSARSCLVSAAEANGGFYIAVVFGGTSETGQNASFVDSRALLSYGVEHCKPQKPVSAGSYISTVPVTGAKDCDSLPLYAATDVSYSLPPEANPADVEKKEYIKKDSTAPIDAGTALGRMEYWYGDTLVGQTLMLTKEPCEAQTFLQLLFSSTWFYVIVFLLFCFWVLVRICKAQAKRRRRRKRAEMRRRSQY